MSGSFQAETTLGEIVNIVEKRGGGAGGEEVLVADDGTEFVKDRDNFSLLTPVVPAADEDGVTADDGILTEETIAERKAAAAAAAEEEDPAFD